MVETVTVARKLERIPLTDILSDDEFNCRGHITPASVSNLADDIERIGLLSPIIVQKWDHPKYKWRIVCGHRRFLAMNTLNRRGVPGTDAIDCIVHGYLSESAAFLLNLSENVKRESLNIVQEALAIKRFYELGMTHKQIAKEVGVPSAWIQVRVALLKLPEVIQNRAAANMLTQHQILEIAGMGKREDQLAAARACVDWKLKGNRGSLKNLKANKKVVKEKSVFETGRARDRKDIGVMQEAVQEALGDDHPIARALGWAAGFVSSYDFGQDVQSLCAPGKRFKTPGEE